MNRPNRALYISDEVFRFDSEKMFLKNSIEVFNTSGVSHYLIESRYFFRPGFVLEVQVSKLILLGIQLYNFIFKTHIDADMIEFKEDEILIIRNDHEGILKTNDLFILLIDATDCNDPCFKFCFGLNAFEVSTKNNLNRPPIDKRVGQKMSEFLTKIDLKGLLQTIDEFKYFSSIEKEISKDFLESRFKFYQ